MDHSPLGAVAPGNTFAVRIAGLVAGGATHRFSSYSAARSSGLGPLFRRCLRQRKNAPMAMANAAAPPTAPPTMAPVLGALLEVLWESLGEVLFTVVEGHLVKVLLLDAAKSLIMVCFVWLLLRGN